MGLSKRAQHPHQPSQKGAQVLHLTPCAATPFKVAVPVILNKVLSTPSPSYACSVPWQKNEAAHVCWAIKKPPLVCTEVGETPIQQLLICLNLITGATRPGKDHTKINALSSYALIPSDWHLGSCLITAAAATTLGEERTFMSLSDFREHSTNPIQVADGLSHLYESLCSIDWEN